MEENKDFGMQTAEKSVKSRIGAWFRDMMAGFAIGVAFIIPGFSGGSVAAILGIYEKMIGAVANIFKQMRRSIITLLPIGIGLVIGAVSLLFPLGWAISAFPLPTVSLFVGFAIGGMPSVTDRLDGRPKGPSWLALFIPMVLALSLSFMPTGADADLFGLSLGGYILLFLIGVIGSCALVIPGISGSMILLVIGYYNPIVNLITNHLFRFDDLGTCILVLGAFGAGIAVGFIIISSVMKILLDRYPVNTYFAIVGFILGSLPTVYISTMKDAGMLASGMELVWLPDSPLTYIFCVLMLSVGMSCAYTFVRYAKGKNIA